MKFDNLKIKQKNVTVREVYEDYANDVDDGVFGFGGKLNIRPKYQREFIYDEPQQIAVVESICNGFPIGNMYWAENDDRTYELLDGQQRTLSICEFIEGNFSVEFEKGVPSYFHTMEKADQEKLLDYELRIYVIKGPRKEKLDWFEMANIQGESLTKQELRNAVYSGSWVSDAKSYFSRINQGAYHDGQKYIKGSCNRQHYLEAVLRWASDSKDDNAIRKYMAEHKDDTSAEPLYKYFEKVMKWVKRVFKVYRKEMKGIEWGCLYNQYKNKKLNGNDVEKRISKLMQDEDVTNKKGIYKYILTGEERHLNIRAFDNKQKRTAFERQNGKCYKCGKTFAIEGMEADHINPWSKGGRTISDNCQMLCRSCNRKKSAK